ncbi:MAG: hypothetical protein EOO65_04350 [Methanosarcinales archaeon]|nr:MAG: hypothetical protein EOO65_04350 [Methanosarcinales archaeon]
MWIAKFLKTKAASKKGKQGEKGGERSTPNQKTAKNPKTAQAEQKRTKPNTRKKIWVLCETTI